MKRTLFKSIITLAFMLVFPASGMAQTHITAQLTDSINKEPEAYATVRVFKQGDTEKPVAMAISDAEGIINIDVKGMGDHTVIISAMGRKEISRSLTLTNEGTINLGTLLVQDDAEQLAGVEIVAQKPIVTMSTDKMSYDLTQDPDQKTMTVLDMLRKVPMVMVDAQDNITVNGSSSFKVLVDGKPNMQMQQNAKVVFKAMPASMVEKIDVITNPGAKYDAEGVGGVLDIHLVHANGATTEETMNGYNGSVGLQAMNIGGNINASISGQQGKLTYYVNAYGGYQSLDDIDIDVKTTQKLTDGELLVDDTQTIDQKYYMASVSAGLDYALDSMSILNVSLGINYGKTHQDTSPTQTYSGVGYTTPSSFTFDNKNRYRDTGINASANYQRFFNEEHTKNLTVGYQFSTNPNHSEDSRYYQPYSDLSTISMYDTYSNNRTNTTEHVVQVDYESPIGNKGKAGTMAVGAKYTYHQNHSDSWFYTYATTTEATQTPYDNNQNILAAYAEYSGKFGKWTTRAGLRYEYTWVSSENDLDEEQNFNTNYGNLVPSISLGYNIGAMTNIGLGYSMRIVRPGVNYLNPYVDNSNPISVSYGNPNLDVAKANNIRLSFNHYSRKLMVNLTTVYSFTGNDITSYSYSTDGVLYHTYSNSAKRKNLRISGWARWMMASKTSLMINGGVGYQDLRSDAIDAHNYGWEGNATIMLEQTLPWEIKMNIGTMLASRTYALQGWSSSQNYGLMTISKRFLSDKLNITVMAMSPFSGKLKQDGYSASQTYVNDQSVRVPLRIIGMAVSWRFGNSKKNFKKYESKITSDFDKGSAGNKVSVQGM